MRGESDEEAIACGSLDESQKPSRAIQSVDNMLVSDLRDKLHSMGLAGGGRKEELKYRLMKAQYMKLERRYKNVAEKIKQVKANHDELRSDFAKVRSDFEKEKATRVLIQVENRDMMARLRPWSVQWEREDPRP